MNNTKQKTKHVGCSYIGSKTIFRLINSPSDYRPLCFHMHSTEDEAMECDYALEFFNSDTLPPYPDLDNKRKKNV